MLRISDPAELQRFIRIKKADHLTVGFVPTMGFLHEGHLSLVKEARKNNDLVVVSIFVNPTQFGPNEDYDSYPRDIERDLRLLENDQVDVVFEPTVEHMYPLGSKSVVSVSGLQDRLCGKSRPGHFDGVTTIVAKLFNIVMPDHAYFGLKDFQQYLIIRKMVMDLNFPLEVVGCPIYREKDGLAMSSRNSYLSDEQRIQASCIYIGLSKCAEKIKEHADYNEVSTSFKQYISENIVGAKIDYFEILDSQTLERVTSSSSEIILTTAVFVGKTRLIDNMII